MISILAFSHAEELQVELDGEEVDLTGERPVHTHKEHFNDYSTATSMMPLCSSGERSVVDHQKSSLIEPRSETHTLRHLLCCWFHCHYGLYLM